MKMMIKKRKRKRFITLIISSLFFSIIVSLIIIYIYSNKVTSFIYGYSENEIKRLMMVIINTSIRESNYNNDVDDLFDIKYNSSGEIILIDFNYNKSTFVLGNITNSIEKHLKEIGEGNTHILENYYTDKELKLLKRGIVLEVPIGTIMGNNFFNNMGPRIPVKVSFVRDVETGFSTEVEEYGINNAMIKLNINIKININVILPIVMDNMEGNYTVPLSMKVVQGKIPSYYMDGFRTNSNIIQGG